MIHGGFGRAAASILGCFGSLMLGPSPAWAQAQPSSVAPTAQAAPAAKPAGDEGFVKGITRCANDLSMSFPVTGRIAAVPVTEGSTVKPGDVLMHLDRAAEAFDVERRRLQWMSTAEVAAAKARMLTSEKQVVAAREIYAGSRGISQEELQNRELAYSLASSEHDRLKNSKEMERLDYLTAKENLERRTLRAPTRGIVTKVIKLMGEGVQANEPAIRVCDLSKILFVANVPALQVGELSANDGVELLVGQDQAVVAGKVIFVSPVVDAASGLREVKVELLRTGAGVRPGMPARLNLIKVKKARS
ncbi:MAG: efflux RND transporter periplasmic adaptor subunit [Rhodocyclaceae bacterium]|nr:efflux RND transporter periplasmic adaptor subunit [Rhodocyclaceae bacterium]